MAKTYNRTVKIYIDGKEVDNTVPGIQKKIRELTRDVKKMTIGTEEYEKKVKDIAQLNGILAEHKRAVRGVAEESQSLGKRLGNMADFFNKWYYYLQTGLFCPLRFSRRELRYTKIIYNALPTHRLFTECLKATKG